MTYPSLQLSSLGQDTEFFLWDTKKEKVVPSYKFFGKKEEEKTFTNTTAGYSIANSGGAFHVYRDGLAVEVNSSPVYCRAWLWQDVKTALRYVQRTRLAEHPEIKFTSRPWVEISHQLIRHFPEDLKVLGCSPTIDAYKDAPKVVLVNPVKTYFRTSGAHMHGSTFALPPEEHILKFIKLCDLLIGLPFTHIFGDELEFKRRKLYGTAGEFRIQKYPNGYKGLEYRVLSSRLYNHPGLLGLFFGLYRFVWNNYPALAAQWDSAWEDDLQEAINLGTPSCFPRLLDLSCNLMRSASTKWGLELGQVSPSTWDTLKAFNLKGAFPDAGVINKMNFAEAHVGWNDYRGEWKV